MKLMMITMFLALAFGVSAQQQQAPATKGVVTSPTLQVVKKGGATQDQEKNKKKVMVTNPNLTMEKPAAVPDSVQRKRIVITSPELQTIKKD